MFNVPISVPKESLYMETGCLSLKYLIKIRRLMYLWHVLHLDEKELVYKFYSAQKLACSKDDWVEQIKKDKMELNLQLSDNQIRSLSKDKFRGLVNMRTKVIAIKCLNEVKSKHSKSSHINLTNLQAAEYLKSKNLNKEEVQTLYKLKYRMINVKQNFKSRNKENIWCKTCFMFPETQQHLTVCPVLKTRLKHLIDFSQMDHQMIFQNIRRQELFTKNYVLLLKAREDMLAEN